MAQVNIFKKQNMYTTALGAEVPIYAYVDFAESISQAADKIALLHRKNKQPIEDGMYIIGELPDFS